MDRAKLLDLARLLVKPPANMNASKLTSLADQFEDAISHPAGLDLVTYPEKWGLSDEPTPEEVVDEALSWRPRALVMTITDHAKHPAGGNLHCYGLCGGTIRDTQAVDYVSYQVGEIVAVALSGLDLPCGWRVVHGFVERAYTVGVILGTTNSQVGRELTAPEIAAFPVPEILPMIVPT